jgi:hypothetical protein
MEIYLLSLALGRHRMIAPSPRRDVAQSAAVRVFEPHCEAPDADDVLVEQSSGLPALQRNPR